MKDIARITLFFALLALPAIVSAQTDDPQKKSEIKVNKLDVIYEDEEYKGVVIDQRNNEETENHLYQSPFLLNEPDEDEDDEDEDLPRGFNLSDDGAESEDEILLEGFDTAAIHLPKLNPAEIEAPITVRLRDLSAGGAGAETLTPAPKQGNACVPRNDGGTDRTRHPSAGEQP